MRAANTYRGIRRNKARAADTEFVRLPQKHSRHRPDEKELIRNAMIPAARIILMTGPKAQTPKFKAVMKTVKWLLASPLHIKAARHIRGSWREWRTA